MCGLGGEGKGGRSGMTDRDWTWAMGMKLLLWIGGRDWRLQRQSLEERSGIQRYKASMAKAPAPRETKWVVWPSPCAPRMCYAGYLLLLCIKATGSSPHTFVPYNCVYPFLPAICISASQRCPTEPAKMLSSTVLARHCSDSSVLSLSDADEVLGHGG